MIAAEGTEVGDVVRCCRRYDRNLLFCREFQGFSLKMLANIKYFVRDISGAKNQLHEFFCFLLKIFLHPLEQLSQPMFVVQKFAQVTNSDEF
jgi:hypothetical protein